MKVGLRMKQRRKELKMSADELGAKLGKNRATIYRYENGYIENLPIDMLKPIADALDTTPQYLMGWDSVDERAILDAKIAKDEELRETVKKYIALPEDKKRTISQMIEDYFNAFANG